MSTATESQEYLALKRGFQQLLNRVGVPITHNSVEKKCVAGPVDRRLAQKLSQSLEELGTMADMFNEDFDALALELNKSVVTLQGEQMIVVAADRDDADPVTHMVLKADH